MKILLILPFFYPHRGGSQKYAEELYATMINLHTEVCVDVLCYNTDNAPEYEEYRGFRIYRIPCITILPARFAIPKPLKLLKTLGLLSQNKYDFVNTHIRFFDPTWWVWFLAKIIGAKSIFTGHVAIHPVHQNKMVEFIAKLVDITIAKFSLRFYDIITFTNKTAQRFFTNRLGLRKSSYIVYGGVDTSKFTPGLKQGFIREIPKIEVKIAEEKVLITYVGRMIWTKGVTYLFEAIKTMDPKIRTKAIFILAGPGELEKELADKIKAEKLQDNVYLTGDLSYQQVQGLLGITDVFVNPSHHNEGFPNTILEAGSCGCYIIATDNAGTYEVIENNLTGALIPQKDTQSLRETITWAIENPKKRTEVASYFRKLLIAKFDWKILTEQMYQLLLSYTPKLG